MNTIKNMSNLVVLITGGAGGIGHSICELFSLSGNKVYSFDITDPSKPLQNVTYIKCNLCKEFEISDSLKQITEKRVDVLINNAAMVKFDSIAQISIETFDKIIATNLRAPFILTKFALPFFEKSNEFGKNPCIINIASTRALMTEPDCEAYSASKGGILALTHALANSLGPKIRVNCISPGWIEVKNVETLREIDHKQHLVGRVGEGKDIAEMCLFLSDGTKSGFITGQNFVVDGGMTKKMIYEL